MTNRWQPIIYGAPAVVLATPVLPVYVILPTYYAENTALTFSLIGLLILLSRLVDVGSDFLIGYFSHSWLHNKRKTLITVGALLVTPSIYALFSPPSDVSALYFLGWSILLFSGYSCIQIPYSAWVPDLSKNYEDVTAYTSSRELFYLLGLVLSACLPAIIVSLGHSLADALRWLAIGAIIVGFILLTNCCIRLPDQHWANKKTPTKGSINNPLFWKLLIAWFFNTLANAVAATSFPVFVTFALGGNEQQRLIGLMIYFISASIGALIGYPWIKKLSKHQVWRYSMGLTIAFFLTTFFLGQGDFMLFWIICLLTGATLGADMILPYAMQSDVVDWDRLKSKRDNSLLLFSYWSAGTKVAQGVAAGGAFLLSGSLTGETQQVLEAPVFLITMIYAGIPCVLKVIAIAMMSKYPLNQKAHTAIKRRLQGMKQQVD